MIWYFMVFGGRLVRIRSLKIIISFLQSVTKTSISEILHILSMYEHLEDGIYIQFANSGLLTMSYNYV